MGVLAEITIPGTLGPRITFERSLLGGVRLRADGEKLRRRGWFSRRYQVTTSDGAAHDLRLAGELTGLKLVIDGTEHALERPMARWQVALVLAPLLLVVVGGILGGVFGAAGAEVNRRVARSGLRKPSKVLGMLVVPFATAGLWLAAAVALGIAVAPIPEYTAGSCLLGVRDARELTEETVKVVDCAMPHDGEVVANVEHPGGSYPGEDALFAFGGTSCRLAFKSYVGVSFRASRLEMLVLYPEEILWLKGDRTIDCIAIAPDDTPLVGSVRGTRQ